jgi:hypothetical protein
MLSFRWGPDRSMVFEVPPRKESSGQVEKESVVGVFKAGCPQETGDKARGPFPKASGGMHAECDRRQAATQNRRYCVHPLDRSPSSDRRRHSVGDRKHLEPLLQIFWSVYSMTQDTRQLARAG